MDRDLRIRKFTARIAELFNLLPQDLEPITDPLIDDFGGMIESQDGEPVDIHVFSFMTTTPNELVATVNHERMPVLLATPVHGSHYLVDVIAGVAIAAVTIAARAVCRRSARAK